MPEPAYFNSYQNFALTRDQHGVLLMRLHTAGGPLVFSGEAQRDLPLLLEEISLDFDNKAMVLTGTGDTFITDVDAATLGDVTNPGFYERYVRQQVIRGHQRLLELPIPVIGVANGPATVHSEYLLLCDIHIASDTATYGDSTHPAASVVAGDGMHVLWEEVVGTARAKWLLWTGETIDAQTALEWGVVSEVVAHDQAVDRGLQIARGLATKPPSWLSLQKETLNLNLRRRLLNDLPTGIALEGLGLADFPYRQTTS